ncbi:MAG: AAA family ATPase [Bacilli bacterium]
MFEQDPYLRAIRLQQSDQLEHWLRQLPILNDFKRLAFHPNVTFIVGENGTGKSTLVEALAMKLDLNVEGGSRNLVFETTASHANLHTVLVLERGVRKPRDGYFLRAESFYNVASTIDHLDREEGSGGSIISSYGGVSLHQQSHGESFFSLFEHRLQGPGLYLLDEPEAALSPMRQLSMLALIHERVKSGSQFIIATHSPILMSYPHAQIFECTSSGIQVVSVEETEHFQTYKLFIESPDRIMRHLLGDD